MDLLRSLVTGGDAIITNLRQEAGEQIYGSRAYFIPELSTADREEGQTPPEIDFRNQAAFAKFVTTRFLDQSGLVNPHYWPLATNSVRKLDDLVLFTDGFPAYHEMMTQSYARSHLASNGGTLPCRGRPRCAANSSTPRRPPHANDLKKMMPLFASWTM